MMMYRTLPLLVLCLWGVGARAQAGGDLEAQILYAFHAEDANQLAALVQTLGTESLADETDDTLRYHLAHAHYRLGLLQAPTHGHDARQAFAGCADDLKGMLRRDADAVEALTLASACDFHLAGVEKYDALLLRARAAERLAQAAALAPRNPRVLLLQGEEALERAKHGSQAEAQAFGNLQLSAQLFEQTSSTRVDAPSWGHAEAYLEFGRQLKLRGDVLAARNWIEKSLLAAPNFKAAQRQLANLASR